MSARDCIHGHLARACNVCELDAMTVRANLLEAEVERLQQRQDEIIVALGSKGLLPSEIVPEIERLNRDINKRCEWAAEMISERDDLRRKLDAAKSGLIEYQRRGMSNDYSLALTAGDVFRKVLAILDAEEERDE